MPAEAGRRLTILYLDTEKVWRGGQEQLYDLMTGIEARGHAVWLAGPRESSLFQRASVANVRVVPFDQRLELSVAAFLRIWKILKGGHFDVVHSNTPRTIITAALAARLTGTRAVFCSRRVDFPLSSRLSRLKYNWTTDRILTISSAIKQTLARGGVKPSIIDVVYEGVDLDWIDKQKTEPLDRSSQGLAVGTVAHLSPEKGHSHLLDAVEILSHSFNRFHLFLVGDGKMKEALIERVSRLGIGDLVTFTGFRTDCEALMKQFDVFCLPSLSEGLSSAILAAMANRLPVVSTSVGGIPELVVDAETGILVPPGKPDRLAEALGKLLENPELRSRMGEAGRRRIEEHFTVDHKLDSTLKSYRELLHQKGIR